MEKKSKEETIRELLYLGYAQAAGAFRLYPDQKHTFADVSDFLMKQGEKIYDQFQPTVDATEQTELLKGAWKLLTWVKSFIDRPKHYVINKWLNSYSDLQDLKREPAEQTAEAVEFAEWISRNQWKRNPFNQKWYNEIDEPMLTQQLYNLFKQST